MYFIVRTSFSGTRVVPLAGDVGGGGGYRTCAAVESPIMPSASPPPRSIRDPYGLRRLPHVSLTGPGLALNHGPGSPPPPHQRRSQRGRADTDRAPPAGAERG